jgi:hypothetical protein
MSKPKISYSRRSILKGAAAFSAASTLSAPMIWAQDIKNVTLRQFGTGVSNLNDVAVKVKEDLGFTLEMTALDSDSVTQRAATQPKSFDIADIEYWICKKGLANRQFTGDRHQQDQAVRQDFADFHHWQADARKRGGPRHCPFDGGFCCRSGCQGIRPRSHQLDDADPHDL